jgi:hypothetical protein
MAIGTGTAIALGSSALGALGSGKSKSSQGQSKTGYEALPSFVQEYLKDDQFDRIKDYGAGEYQGMPTRTFNRDDYDPTFGSQRRIEYGDQKISELLSNLRNPEEVTETEDSAPSDMQSGFLDSLLSTVNRQNPRGNAIGGGTYTGELAETLRRGGGDLSGALESYGFTPDNYRTQNLSPQAIGALLKAAQGGGQEAAPQTDSSAGGGLYSQGAPMTEERRAQIIEQLRPVMGGGI